MSILCVFENIIIEELDGNVSTATDVTVKSVMSVVSVVRGLFYYTI